MDFVQPAAGHADNTDAAGPVLKKMGKQVRFETPARPVRLLRNKLGTYEQSLADVRTISPPGLDQNVFDYLPFYIRESEVSAAIPIG
jgi:hypothetical protein